MIQQREQLPLSLVTEQRNSVLLHGHHALLTNSNDYKSYLLDEEAYSKEITLLLQYLSEATSASEQAKFLAILIELDVADPTRIGEPLINSLIHDLQIKANGEFKFLPGDKNLAAALLQILDIDDHPIAELIRTLCVEHGKAGLVTPFDYRGLAAMFRGDWTSTTVQEWIDFFSGCSLSELRAGVDIGLSFSSTRAQRLSDQKEIFIRNMLKGKIASLLDIGGSIGVNSKHLMELLGIESACVTDYRTEEQLKRCFYGGFEKQVGVSYVLGEAGDITKGTPNNELYDLVTINNVLVHIREKELAILNILPRVADGGYLLLAGGYNGNYPKRGFWLFMKENGQLIDCC